jgi:ABC-2 type transport system ATP-binding protein
VAGIIPPSAGTIVIDGHDLGTDPVSAKRTLAFFPDEPRLFEYLSVRQHLAFIARLYGVAAHEPLAAALSWTYCSGVIDALSRVVVPITRRAR